MLETVATTTSAAPPRTLPRTGLDSGALSGLGAGLLMLGVLVVLAVGDVEEMTQEGSEK